MSTPTSYNEWKTAGSSFGIREHISTEMGQQDLDLLLSLQDRVLETPPASPSSNTPVSVNFRLRNGCGHRDSEGQRRETKDGEGVLDAGIMMLELGIIRSVIFFTLHIAGIRCWKLILLLVLSVCFMKLMSFVLRVKGAILTEFMRINLPGYVDYLSTNYPSY